MKGCTDMFANRKNLYKKGFSFCLALTLFATILSLSLPNHAVEAATQATFYIDAVKGNDSNDGKSIDSAFKTITKAKSVVRTINKNMTGDINVYLRGGTYKISSTITFDASDSGTNGFNVIYKAYQGETPIVSGGVDISLGWTLHDAAKNIYKRTGVNWAFRQLYVEGKKAIRARAPNLVDESTGGGYYSFSDTTYPFDIKTSEIGIWANSGSCEFVYIAQWYQKRGVIDYYSSKGTTSTVYFKEFQNLTYEKDSFMQTNGYYYMENAYQLLDAEGEWYRDSKTSTLFYKPLNGQSMSSIQVTAPKIETLFNFKGTSGSKIHNIQINGIAFMHSNWVSPDTNGYFTIQTGHSSETSTAYSFPLPGMVDLQYAKNLRIEKCTFKLGGAWGIMERLGSDHNAYVGNSISNLASGGICIGNSIEGSSMFGAIDIPGGTGAFDLISRNTIDSVGTDYRDAVGINTLTAKDVTVSYNEVMNLPYTGITQGFQWDDTGRQDADYNTISYNKVHNVMRLLCDGAGVYSLGKMKNSIINNNYIFNLTRSPYAWETTIAGIYLDNGSCFKTVDKNVLNNTNETFYAANPPNHDNILSNNYYNVDFGKTGTNKLLNNISVSGQNWPQGAIDIMNATGPGDGTPIAVTSVNLNVSNTTLKVPQTLQLKASVYPENADYKAVRWSSSNTKVATVSSRGIVYTKGPGLVTITSTTFSEGKTATCNIVITQSVKSVKLNKTNMSITKGKSYKLIPTINPSNASNKKVIWESSNKANATVSSTGTVKGIKKGTAYIYVYTFEGKKSAKCKVIVN